LIICIAGKNDIASSCLEYTLNKSDDVVALPCRDDDGTDTWQRSLVATANRNGVPIISLDTLYKYDDLILFSLEYDRILAVDKFRSSGLFNIHFSLLPSYRGSYTSVWPILNGDSESGVTLHEIDSGIDTGPIIDQLKFPISVRDTARDLYFKYLDHGISLFIQNFPYIYWQSYVSRPQSVIGASFYSRKSIDFSNIHIDFKKTAFEVHNQIRAFVFPEYQIPVVFGQGIGGSWITSDRSIPKAGNVVYENDTMIRVATMDYDVVLEKAG
jgi:methionyl-tRNA formyltransferase